MNVPGFIKSKSPAILTGIGLAAGVGALYFTYKKAPVISAILNDPNKTKKEKFFGVLKEGAIPIGLAAISGGCVIGGQYVAAVKTAKATQAAVTASTAAAVASKELRDFQTKTREIVGDEKFKEIKESIIEDQVERGTYSDICQPTNTIKCNGGGNTLWYDTRHDRWFRCAPQHIDNCIDEINTLISNQDYATVMDLYSAVGIKSPDDNARGECTDAKFGWTSYDQYSCTGRAQEIELVECKVVPHPETGELGRCFEIYPSPIYEPEKRARDSWG